jgi:WD40 repeat protein
LYSFSQPTAHREFAEDLGIDLRRATISPDGHWLAASGDRYAAVWDLSGKGAGALDDQAYKADFCFTQDGKELFASRNEGTPACFRWQLTPSTNAAASPVLSRLPLHTPKGLTTLSLVSNCVVMTSSEGSQILSPGQSKPANGRWAPTSSGINGVSPDGRWLGIRRHREGSLYIYRLPQLEEVAKLTHPIPFADFQFSPHGDEVAIGSIRAGRLMTFWNTTTWEQTRALTNFSRMLYTPDVHTLWLHNERRRAGLYDARTLEPLLLLPTGMFPLALSPDGGRLAVSVDAQRLQLWDLAVLREQLRELGLDWADQKSKKFSDSRGASSLIQGLENK